MFKFHIPTEQYGYIETEVEYDSMAEALTDYKLTVSNQEGLNDKEFRELLDEYLETGTVVNGVDRYLKLNKSQQMIIQVVKRSVKRLNIKNQ